MRREKGGGRNEGGWREIFYGGLERRRTMIPILQGSVELMGNRCFHGWGLGEMRDGFGKTEANSG